ncbi:MAG: M48 family metalloprotease [Candidatus Omnitrophica bacterium]|nr:hypothetical protein [bacterium]NUN97613.1 M48 family metalloprotease [Candidatus Omnitrophota bacterium]
MTPPSVLETLDQFGFVASRILLGLLWQSSILFLLAFLLSRALRSRSASSRRGLLLWAVLATPTIPFFSIAASRMGAPQVPVYVLPAYDPNAHVAPTVRPEVAWEDDALLPLSAFPQIPAQTPSATDRGTPFDYPWALLVCLYGMIAGGMLLQIGMGRWRIRSWITTSRPVRDRRVLRLHETARELLALRKQVLIRESSRVNSPLTVGLWRPCVLVPGDLGVSLSDDELLAVAAHELAHVKRHDPLVLFGIAIVRAILFFHPLVWLASRQIGALIEQTADETVLNATQKPLAYARLLVHFAETLRGPRISVNRLAAGIVLCRSTFVQRVEAVLSGSSSGLKRLTRTALMATLCAWLASMGLALSVPLSGDASDPDLPGPHGLVASLHRFFSHRTVLAVGQGERYPTISEALSHSKPGDVIEITDSRVYEESFRVRHSLALVSHSNPLPVLLGAIRFEAAESALRLDGIEITNPGGNGVEIVSATGSKVFIEESNIVCSGSCGIWVNSPFTEIHVRSSNILDNGRRGIEFSSERVQPGTSIRVEGCLLARNGLSFPTDSSSRGRAIQLGSMKAGILRVADSVILVTPDGKADRAIQLDSPNLQDMDFSFLNTTVMAPVFDPLTGSGNTNGIGFKIKSATATVRIDECRVVGFRHAVEVKTRGFPTEASITDSEFRGFVNGRGLILEGLSGRALVENVSLIGNPGVKPVGGDEALRIRFCTNLMVNLKRIFTSNTEEAITIDQCLHLDSVLISQVELNKGLGGGANGFKFLSNGGSLIRVEGSLVKEFQTGVRCSSLAAPQEILVRDTRFLDIDQPTCLEGSPLDECTELTLVNCEATHKGGEEACRGSQDGNWITTASTGGNCGHEEPSLGIQELERPMKLASLGAVMEFPAARGLSPSGRETRATTLSDYAPAGPAASRKRLLADSGHEQLASTLKGARAIKKTAMRE